MRKVDIKISVVQGEEHFEPGMSNTGTTMNFSKFFGCLVSENGPLKKRPFSHLYTPLLKS